MTTKTLGQVAYEAVRTVPWERIHEQDRLDWQAAAEAVALEAERRSLVPGVLVQLEGAIIEAAVDAKVALAWACNTGDMSYEQAADFVSELGTLHEAVEAYEKEKG